MGDLFKKMPHALYFFSSILDFMIMRIFAAESASILEMGRKRK